MIANIISIVFIIALIDILISCSLWCRNHEKKLYNGGYCLHCGKPLRYFDCSSQGDRGYKCSDCNLYVWVSYNVDKVYPYGDWLRKQRGDSTC